MNNGTAGGNGTGAAALSGTQWTIASGGHEAVVVEVGGGLRAYRVGGVDVLDGYGEHEISPASAGQVLAPWPNRIRDGRYAFGGDTYQLALTEPARHNAIHGLVNWQPWQLVEHRPDAVTIECPMPAQVGYPWPLLVRTRWSVGAGGLTAHHEVTNVSAARCPFGLSVHPYLRLPGVPVDQTLLTVPARSRLLLDGRLLPIGAAKVTGGDYDFTEPKAIGSAALDVTFGDVEPDEPNDGPPAGASAVRLAGGDSSLRIWADGAFRWWQVFTGDTLHGERLRRSIAVEPMTCPPDAFRSGRDVIVLQPGQTWSARWGISPTLG